MQTLTFRHALDIETASLQAAHPILADAIGRAHALLIDGKVFPCEDGLSAEVGSSTDPSVSYTVNGSCTCKASEFRAEPCKHRLGYRLYQRVADRLAEEEERWTVDLDGDTVAPPPVIPADGLTMIQGKPFVRFEALLQMAHAQGLLRLETTMVQCSEVLAVCQATATFKDGRVFTDIGDATERNVPKHLAPHFIRLAATRASARALRRALNLSVCSLEELDGSEVTHG
jgi:hypothetical protein